MFGNPGTTFGQPGAQTPSFGQSAAPAPAFGQSAAPSFGQSPAPAPAFGQSAAPAPAFGQSAAPAPAFGQSAAPSFGQSAAPSFGQSAAPAPAFAVVPALGPGFGSAPVFAANTAGAGGVSQNSGYEGELRKFLDIRRQYAAIHNDTTGTYETGENYGQYEIMTNPKEIIPWNDDCLFKFTMYLDKKLAEKLNKNNSMSSDDLLPHAEENNPNHEKLSPVTMRGIHSLKGQFQRQNQKVEDLMKKIEQIKNHQFIAFRSKSDDFAIRIRKYQSKYNEQNGRLIKLLRDVEYLRSRNRPLEKKEIEHRGYYDDLIFQKNQCMQRLLQLEETNNIISQMSNSNSNSNSNNNTSEEYLEISDEDLDRIYHLLKEKQIGIHKLGDILQTDTRNLEIMRSHYYKNE
jgi:hypothetical protein